MKIMFPIIFAFTCTVCNQKTAVNNYQCDGRVYCSEMTSCEEAEWFLKNCPDTKMDGDNDGIPCEGQWCGR